MSHYSEKIKFSKTLKHKLHRRYFKNLGKTLDLGCSIGLLIQHDPGNIYGIDRDWNALVKSRQWGGKVVYGDLADQKLPFQDKRFDAANLDNVIEHLTPEQGSNLLREIYRVLKPCGRLVLRTPDVKRAGKAFLKDPEHKTPYDKEKLLECARNAGFHHIQVHHWAFNYLKWIPLVRQWYRLTDKVEDWVGAIISNNWVVVAQRQE